MKRFLVLALLIGFAGCRPAPEEATVAQVSTPPAVPTAVAEENSVAPAENVEVPLPKNNFEVVGGEEFLDVASGKEAGDKAFAQLITASYAYLRGQQAKCIKEFHLGQTDRFDLDQYTGQITFSSHGKPQIIANFQIVGDVSTKSNTWLWAWGNSSLNPVLTKDAKKVADYGDKHKFELLTQKTWPATEADGWAMTAIAAKILHAKGAYRAPSRQGPLFVGLTSLRRPKK